MFTSTGYFLTDSLRGHARRLLPGLKRRRHALRQVHFTLGGIHQGHLSPDDNDRKRARQIAEEAWQKEISQMLKNDFKLEVEALIRVYVCGMRAPCAHV